MRDEEGRHLSMKGLTDQNKEVRLDSEGDRVPLKILHESGQSFFTGDSPDNCVE